MGCFDSVSITCPNCHRLIEFQSKAGRCWMYHYNENQVPICIADDIEGEEEECPYCHLKVVATQLVPINRVAMHGVLAEHYKGRDINRWDD